MPHLTKTMCESIVYHYFLQEGWLPAGTTASGWRGVTMGQMQFDDPPLPFDPDLQKKRVAADLQRLFFLLGNQLASPFDALRDAGLSLGDFALWCRDHHERLDR